jgi:hypothetical protein
LFRGKVEIESEDDANFIRDLAMTQVEREQIRELGQGVFSPSGLADCLRRVYLGRHWRNLDIERVELPSVQVHSYFTMGDFTHLRWQFAIHRLAQRNPRVKLLGCEIPLLSKHKDHGGTLDVLMTIDEIPYAVDIKGLNVYTFGQVVKDNPPNQYVVQVGDYMMLANAIRQKVWPTLPRITNGILLVENKGGPDASHSLGIHEVNVSLDDVLPEVRSRLEVLRKHERAEKIPAPECRSTKSHDFQSCPFAEFCRPEVERFERRDAKARNARPLQLATPGRNRRSR